MNRTLPGICICSVAALSATAAWTAADTTADGAAVPPISHVFTEADDFEAIRSSALTDRENGRWSRDRTKGNISPV